MQRPAAPIFYVIVEDEVASSLPTSEAPRKQGVG
jgi:hypothetical protein